ncbi:hypothetical protein KDV94_06280, partial [Providencia rettgeri]
MAEESDGWDIIIKIGRQSCGDNSCVTQLNIFNAQSYGLAWGLNQGLLEEARYLPLLEKSWCALQSCIHPNGMLGWV